MKSKKYIIYLEGLSEESSVYTKTYKEALRIVSEEGKAMAKRNESYGDCYYVISTSIVVKQGYVHYNSENGKFSYIKIE